MTAKNDVTFVTDGLTKTLGNVNVTSTGGAIVNNNTAGNLNIIANNAVLQSATGLGSAGNLATDVSNLSAKNKTSGNIWIQNDGNLAVASLAGFGGLINTAPLGQITLDNKAGNISVDAPIETNGGNISLTTIGTGNISQSTNGDVTIHQIDNSLANKPIITGSSHTADDWVAGNATQSIDGASNDNSVRMDWKLSPNDTTLADYVATAAGAYTMAPGAEINTNGGDVTITANGGSATLATINASNGNVQVTATSSILAALGGASITGHSFNSALLGLGASVFHAPTTGFKYYWTKNPTSNEPTTSYIGTPVYTGGDWIFSAISTVPDGTDNYFHVATTQGLALPTHLVAHSSDSAAFPDGGAFYIDTVAPDVTAAITKGTLSSQLGATWYVTPVEVTADATDIPGAGVNATSEVNGTTWDPTNPLTVTALGNHSVTFEVADYAGNVGTTETPVDFTIKKIVTITAQDQTLTYGTALDGTKFTVTPLEPGDTVSDVALTTNATLSTSGNYNVNAPGTPWTITAYPSGTVDTSKYELAYVDGDLTVNPKALKITANADSKTYDAVAYSGGNGVAYSGFVTGEDESVLGGTLGYSGDSQGAKNVGSYTITPEGLTSDNYDITFVDGTLTIGQKGLTITANADSKTYDAVAYSGGNGVAYSGFATGEDESVLGGTLGYSGDSQGAKNVGSYTITPEGLTSDNYDIT
ncbi:MAG: hypothetical protein KTQ49_00795, partial [Candidatus Omnitrophica bacterium]|nr:hypothetical protein [Candidatus Omnitrophota bacterium]